MKRKPPTARQHLALRLLAEGCSNKEIGERMEISAAGAKKHLEALRRRYGVSWRTAIVRAAIEAGELRIPVRGRARGKVSRSR